MKIITASDSYKGCLSSMHVSDIMKEAILDVDPQADVRQVVIADGGEGFIQAMVYAKQGKVMKCQCVDKELKPCESRYGIIDEETAVMEVAKIIGLVKRKGSTPQPLKYSSFGVGKMIADLVQKGYRHILLGLGGSATNDGGMGLLQGLGVRFYDAYDTLLYPKAENLLHIRRIDASQMADLSQVRLTVACDVKNPLLGPQGATYVFGPQKGLSNDQLEWVEQGMRNYRDRLQEAFGVDVNSFPGSGAAGGIGAVCFGILHAEMRLGIELVLEAIDFSTLIEGADLVLTGEGQTDAQSLQGKAVYGILQAANQKQVPVICISGALRSGYEALYEQGAAGIYSIVPMPMSYPMAFQTAKDNLYHTVYAIIRTWLKGRYGK